MLLTSLKVLLPLTATHLSRLCWDEKSRSISPTVDYMQLIGGSWTAAAAKVHGPLQRKIKDLAQKNENDKNENDIETTEKEKERVSGSNAPTDAQLQEMVSIECQEIVRRLQYSNNPAAQRLRNQAARARQQNPDATRATPIISSATPELGEREEDIFSSPALLPCALECPLRRAGYSLLTVGMSSTSAEFSSQIRGLVVHQVGFLYKYVREHWFTSKKDVEDLNEIIKTGVTYALSSSSSADTGSSNSSSSSSSPSSSSRTAGPSSMMVSMMMPMVMNLLQQWVSEYETKGPGVFEADCAEVLAMSSPATPLLANTTDAQK